jgi:glyoxylase-like metal-dependent hydrolase (beta-lactamase superfamily II)
MRARRFFAICLAAGLSLTLSAAASHDNQAPGWFRYRLGGFLVTALQDGSIHLPVGSYRGMPADRMQALVPHPMAADPSGVPTSVNAYLVDTGAHRILVDAGNADCYGWHLGGLIANLKAAGYRPAAIDIVLLTHLHGDHVCGLVAGGKRIYPRAAVWVAAEEAAYWLDPANQRTPPQVRAALALYGRDVHTFHAGDTIVPGMTIVPIPGHTPGHTAFRFTSNGAALLLFGDIVHNHFLQFAHPEISVMSDFNPAQAVATRQRLFAELAAENTVVAGAHLPFPGIGWLRRDGDGYAFTPVEFAPRP